MTVLFITFAGRVRRNSTWPWLSVISSRWVMNWSRLESIRSAFFAADCPTWLTAAIWRPSLSNTLYWLLSSMSLAF